MEGNLDEGPEREVGEPFGLPRGGLGEIAAALADLHGEIRRKAVEQSMAVRVPRVGAVAPADHENPFGLPGALAGEVAPQVASGAASEVAGGLMDHRAPHACLRWMRSRWMNGSSASFPSVARTRLASSSRAMPPPMATPFRRRTPHPQW